MNKDITPATACASGVEEAWRDIGASFERFCLTAGIATLVEMMERDTAELSGQRYSRPGRQGRASLGTGGGQARFPRRQGDDRMAPFASPRGRCRAGRRHRPRTGWVVGR